MSESNTPAAIEEPIVFEVMVATLVKPAQDILDKLTPTEIHNVHMAIGVAGEAGELMEAIEAYHGSEGAILNRENVIEEMGDYEFFAEGLRVTTVVLTL